MTLRDVDYQTVSEALRAYSGTSVARMRAELIEARLEQIARARGLRDVAPLIDNLRSPHDGTAGELVEGLVNCETSFFRDAPAFTALREHVLPAVMQRRAKVRQVRVLCAACSTGQEAYSVAMLVREHFPELARWNVEILGVDISAKRISRATAGVYSKRELERGMPPDLVSKYFQPYEGQHRVVAALRTFTQFRRVNLNASWMGLVGFDVLLLRNLLIYLDDTAKAGMLNAAHHSLQRQGFLLLGAAETVSATRELFERVPYPAYPIYTRRDA